MVKHMKRLIKLLFTCGIFMILLGIFFCYKDQVYVYVDQYLSPYKYVVLGDVNEYYRDQDFLFVQNTKDFVPKNFQDLKNIYYTAINAGKESFTFYCTKEYKDCFFDIQDIANDQDLLSDINNYVHPYNGFSHIETEYDTAGKITIKIEKRYSEKQITEINQEIDRLAPELILPDHPLEENISRVHNYIISHTVYDTARAEHDDTTYESDIAYGPLFQGMGICGGYTDLMQLFLERMNVKNFRVSSENHVWNAVYLDDQWYHLDLTWDDPVRDDGVQTLGDDYFLITTNQLLEVDTDEQKEDHKFNRDHYSELKEA